MAWIRTLTRAEATGRLAKLYRAIAGPSEADDDQGQIDNILRVHSLRPRTLEGHLALYKAALHSAPTSLSKVETELVGAYVSALNGCRYCVEHHRAALARRLSGPEEAAALLDAALEGAPHPGLSARARAMLGYADKLTREPQAMVEGDLGPLREQGLDDATILELNQVVAYFAYANRTVLGLGVDTQGEVLGLHPPDGGDSLEHR